MSSLHRASPRLVLGFSFGLALALGWGTARADLVAPPTAKEECTVVAKVKELGRKCESCDTDCETKYPKHGEWFKACWVEGSDVAVYCKTAEELTPEQVTAIVNGADPAAVYAGNLSATPANASPATTNTTSVEAKAKAEGSASGGCACDATDAEQPSALAGLALLAFAVLSVTRRRARP